jgi:hypothetical protein
LWAQAEGYLGKVALFSARRAPLIAGMKLAIDADQQEMRRYGFGAPARDESLMEAKLRRKAYLDRRLEKTGPPGGSGRTIYEAITNDQGAYFLPDGRVWPWTWWSRR